MYEVKCKLIGKDKPVVVVIEDATDVFDVCTAAPQLGIDEIYAIYLSRYVECYDAKPEAIDTSWYSASFVDVQLDADTGKEKRITQKMLIRAENLSQAHSKLTEVLAQGYDIATTEIKQTKILEVVQVNSDALLLRTTYGHKYEQHEG